MKCKPGVTEENNSSAIRYTKIGLLDLLLVILMKSIIQYRFMLVKHNFWDSIGKIGLIK